MPMAAEIKNHSVTEKSCQPRVFSCQNQQNFKAKSGKSYFFSKLLNKMLGVLSNSWLATQSVLLPLGQAGKLQQEPGPYLKQKCIYTHIHIDFFPHALLLYISSRTSKYFNWSNAI